MLVAVHMAPSARKVASKDVGMPFAIVKSIANAACRDKSSCSETHHRRERGCILNAQP